MIRFEPDSLTQAFTRYFDMVAPDANIYIEIPAPDIRFAAIAVLAVAVAAVALRRKLPAQRSPVIAMLLLTLVSTALWLASSGNGRYFMAMLVCAGPVAVGLVRLLPVTRGFQAAIVALLVGMQLFLLGQQTPWNAWTFSEWRDGGYFAVHLGPEETQAPPTTYASLSLLTYSLIAPQFPPGTRWINIHAAAATSRDGQWTDEYLRKAFAAGPVKLIAPSVTGATTPEGLPDKPMVEALGRLVAERNLRISGECHLIRAPGLLAMAEHERNVLARKGVPVGFWTCPLAYDKARADSPPRAVPEAVMAAFFKLGELCPRFFPAGEAHPLRLSDGWTVHYGSETRAYVLDNQDVWYHHWRALNPVLVGKAPDLLAGTASVDCEAIRGDGAWRTGAQ